MQPEQPSTNQTPAPNAEPNLGNEPAPLSPPMATARPNRLSKKLLITVGAILVVLIGGGVAGALWWTSPQKAFSDAMPTHELPTSAAVKGSIVATPASGPSVTVDFTSKFNSGKSYTDLGFKVNAGAVNLNLTGAVATSDTKSVFFKVNDVRKTIESFAGSNASAVDQVYGNLINKIDNKWVEVTESDMKEVTKGAGVDISCLTNTLQKVTTGRSYISESYDLYQKNAYLSVKETLGSESVNGKDSHHYIVTVDKTKMKEFDKALEASKLGAELKKWTTKDTSTMESVTNDAASTPKFEIWVDKWSHKLTKFVMTQDQDGTNVKLTATVDYAAQSVTMPKADTQFKDLQSEIQKMQQQFTPAEASTSLDLSQI
ncbi:MAG: hypothetical protein WAU02_03885 [Candidatus Saccharimonadales bacterium]